MKKALCLLLALLLALLMPGCGAAQGAPTVPETPESEALIITGDYTLFALSYADQLVAADAMELFSTLTLAENGGSLTIGAEQGRVLDWEVRDGQLTLHSTLGSFSGMSWDSVAVAAMYVFPPTSRISSENVRAHPVSSSSGPAAAQMSSMLRYSSSGFAALRRYLGTDSPACIQASFRRRFHPGAGRGRSSAACG